MEMMRTRSPLPRAFVREARHDYRSLAESPQRIKLRLIGTNGGKARLCVCVCVCVCLCVLCLCVCVGCIRV